MYVKYINKYKTIINKCKENYIKYNICKKIITQKIKVCTLKDNYIYICLY